MSTSPLVNPGVNGIEFKIPIYKDIVNATTNLADGKLRLGDITSVIDLGMGLLDTILDPLGAILRSGVDFLMRLIVESITPLKEAVDWLLGDPGSIAAVSQQWTETANRVADSGNAFVDSLPGLGTWEGPAAEAYKGVVRQTHGVYTQASESATAVAGWVSAAGAIVGIFREFLWGLLVNFVTEVIKAAVLAVASAVPTVGASVAAFGTWFSARMSVIAGKFTRTLSRLMSKMADLCRRLGMSGRAFAAAADKLRAAASRLGQGAATGFSCSGVPSSPHLPGRTDVSQTLPGYQVVKDVNKHGKKVTDAADKVINATDTTTVKDLPEGY